MTSVTLHNRAPGPRFVYSGNGPVNVVTLAPGEVRTVELHDAAIGNIKSLRGDIVIIDGTEVMPIDKGSTVRSFATRPLSASPQAGAAKPAIVVEGMHGLGDNIHQRALIRQLMERHEVWLSSSWVSVYHDLIANGLKVIKKPTHLRTQAKNSQREHSLFNNQSPPKNAKHARVWYPPERVRTLSSVLAAMCEATGCDYSRADFRLPVPQAWHDALNRVSAGWKQSKPLMVFRPPVARVEWGGCANRNPDATVYLELFSAIRDRFFVVSVADLVPKVEWLSGHTDWDVDVKLHSGELSFEAMAALFSRAALVFTPSGFPIPLAQAVGTPVVAVFGGYENSRSFSAGARYSQYLGIDPDRPCSCFSHSHACDKRITISRALTQIDGFLSSLEKRKMVTLPRIAKETLSPVPFDYDRYGLPRRFMNDGEIEVLIALAGSVSARHMVEIGVNEGRTAKALLQSVSSLEKYTGIDVLPGYQFRCNVQRNELPQSPGRYAADDPRFNLILRQRGTFDVTADELGSCDVVFIDGDHSAQAIEHDTALARKIVRPGGLIIWHDYHDLGTVDVREVLHRWRADGRDVVAVEGTWIAYERMTWHVSISDPCVNTAAPSIAQERGGSAVRGLAPTVTAPPPRPRQQRAIAGRAPVSDVAIVVGGAASVEDELREAAALSREIGQEPTLIVVNDMIPRVPGQIVAASLHVHKLGPWLAARAKAGHPPPIEVWAHHKPRQGVVKISHCTGDWGGSGGLFATQVAIQRGHQRIILAGVPMDMEAGHVVRGVPWQDARRYRKAWDDHFDQLAGIVRSMSGWTAARFGTADLEFLR